MKRSDSVGVWSTIGRAALILLLSAVPAAAQDTGAGTAEPSSASDDVGPARTYFEQFPDEPGALTYEDLSAREQEAVMLMAERTDYGPDVHAAWSAVARSAAEAAAAQRATYASGMNGLAEVGVQ